MLDTMNTIENISEKVLFEILITYFSYYTKLNSLGPQYPVDQMLHKTRQKTMQRSITTVAEASRTNGSECLNNFWNKLALLKTFCDL
jgi:hypothetical protein